MSSSPAVAAPQSFKSVEDLVGLIVQITNAVIAAPKPLTGASLSELLPMLPQIETVFGELSALPQELGAMTFAEGTALVGIVGANLKLTDAKAIAVINASLQLVASAVALATAIKG